MNRFKDNRHRCCLLIVKWGKRNKMLCRRLEGNIRFLQYVQLRWIYSEGFKKFIKELKSLGVGASARWGSSFQKRCQCCMPSDALPLYFYYILLAHFSGQAFPLFFLLSLRLTLCLLYSYFLSISTFPLNFLNEHTPQRYESGTDCTSVLAKKYIFPPSKREEMESFGHARS